MIQPNHDTPGGKGERKAPARRAKRWVQAAVAVFLLAGLSVLIAAAVTGETPRAVLVDSAVWLPRSFVQLFTGESPDTSGDGTGHRAMLEPPASMRRGVCPASSDKPGTVYHWDPFAYASNLEAAQAHCPSTEPEPTPEVPQEREPEPDAPQEPEPAPEAEEEPEPATSATTQSAVCPEHRSEAGLTYSWDSREYQDALAAEIEYCGKIDTGPLGNWVVQEQSDRRGDYSISAHVEAAADAVMHDWGGFKPTLWVTCWRGEARRTESVLEVWLWYFGPPQFVYGEPTPAQYQFAGQTPSPITLWWGHPGQAEILQLLPPTPDLFGQEVNSLVFAEQMRAAAAANRDDRSGPTLFMETWEGQSVYSLGASQGQIEFDLLGLQRAAFPVFDACGLGPGRI